MLLHLHEWGDHDAPAIVCLHGITTHGLRFRRLAEERLAHRFRVLAPDLRGHGRSGWEPPWNLSTHLADVIETVDAAGVGRATWLGHSFGARLILELCPDGRLRWRYCRAAVATGYGELCTAPPPPTVLPEPSLLVHAEHFGLVREDQLQEYAETLGDRLEIVAVPGGHVVYWDSYEQTADALERFLT